MAKQNKKDTLIALLKYKKDFYYASTQHWYRIPTSSKNAPIMVKDKSLKIIAFYFPKIFGDDAFSIQYFGEVKNITIKKRKEFIKNSKSDKEYYFIEFDKLYEIPNPIFSLRHRRMTFITTTEDRLKYAREFNDLFYESPLEEKMWSEFNKLKISAERQFRVDIHKNKYFELDFALFCKARKIAVECDGDTYHMGDDNVRKDKERDNILLAKGWDTLRYTSKDINDNLDKTISQVSDVLNRYGGIENPKISRDFKYIKNAEDSQPTLF